MKMTIASLSLMILQMAGSAVQAGVPGFPGDDLFCTAEIGTLINEEGDCAEYTNGCEKNDLYNLGFREQEVGEICNISREDRVVIQHNRSDLGAE